MSGQPRRSRVPLLAALAAALAAGLLRSAFAAPCDTRLPGIDYLAPPYDEASLRDTLQGGLHTVSQLESPVLGTFHRRTVVLAAGADGLTMREETLEPELRGRIPDGEHTLAWGALRDWACFPAERAERSRATLETAFGALSGWRYEAREDAFRVTLFFADRFPALPMLYERYEGSMLVLRRRQIWRSDVLPAADAVPETPEAPAGDAPPGPGLAQTSHR